ncbi:hypothetical protein [Microbulbifer marinus]|uniref:hypothetical protein n=1 Tax=Microbulbifer marinus TaxID=658218 RepID=UPI0011151AD6|nr:hypothetical protein [Microbulbifer marinus]
MKFLPIIIGIFPGLILASTIPLDKEVVQVRECGLEQRDGRGQLLPIAVSTPLELNCLNCKIEFNFDVAVGGGYPTNVSAKSSGISKQQENWYKNTFSRGWVFPGCSHKGKARGFQGERRAFNA